MPSKLPLALQTVYADLLERSKVAAFERDFPQGASFFKTKVKDREYWYAQTREGDRIKKRYVGPDSEEVRKRVDQHLQAKSAWNERRQMVNALRRSGVPAPDILTGAILQALADAGVFRLRAVLVGTVAFQAYAPILGVTLPGTAIRTSDLDLAQSPAISVVLAEDEQTPPLGQILTSVDKTFRPVSSLKKKNTPVAFKNSSEYRVEVLAAHRGPDRDAPLELPAIQSHGTPLRFMDFLIYQEIPAVILHEAGVLVNVPAPERYALHKLIVARRRREGLKVNKDLQQAATLLETLADVHKHELAEAWKDAWNRGPTWQKLLAEGLGLIPSGIRDLTLRSVGERRSVIPGLDLKFDAPSLRYDHDRDVIAFMGTAGNARVRCAVSREALDDHFGTDGLKSDGRLEIVRKKAEQFQRMARTKYLTWPIEEFDSVLIKTADVEQLQDVRKQK